MKFEACECRRGAEEVGFSVLPRVTSNRCRGLRKRFRARCLACCLLGVNLLAGCSTLGTVSNRLITTASSGPAYTVQDNLRQRGSDEITLVLTFSGGGMRAAALAYGVLQELRDTSITLDGRRGRLLDEIDVISAVSGGSFTAAYFGLNGDGLFEDFEGSFLRHNVTGELLNGLFNPMQWFSSRGRTDMAVDYYERILFKGATFADLQRSSGPLIVINASDLARGVRFSFLQGYFDLLCSDLASYPVSRAVTASAAVPLLFNPVVLENHSGCEPKAQKDLQLAQVGHSTELELVVDGLRSYAQKDTRRFIHLVDGGLTDNLGLRALFEIIEVAGGPKRFLGELADRPARYFVVISVNASTNVGTAIDAVTSPPTLEQTINAVSDIQLHRYNAATLALMDESIKRWAGELKTPQRPVHPYFAHIDFRGIQQAERRKLLNLIPTGFSLQSQQVDALIAAGRDLLRENPEFRRFLSDLSGRPAYPAPGQMVP